MFNFAKSDVAVVTPLSAPVASVRGLAEARWQAAVWRLTTISRAEFDATYGPFFKSAAVMLDKARRVQGRGATREDEFALMSLVVAVLKVRQARIVPRTATLEDAARMGETVSFALVVSVVLEQAFKSWSCADLLVNKARVCPLVSGIEQGTLVPGKVPLDPVSVLFLVPSILSETAMKWLWREPVVINELVRYFTAPARAEFAEIIILARKTMRTDEFAEQSAEKVSATITAHPAIPEAVSLSEPHSAAGIGSQHEAGHEVSAGNQSTSHGVEPGNGQETQLEAAPGPMALKSSVGAGQGPSTGSAKHTIGLTRPIPPKQANSSKQATPSKRAIPAGRQVVQWLAEKIQTGVLTVNQKNSAIHVLRDGTVFAQVPASLEPYAQAHQKQTKTVLNQLGRSKTLRHRSDGTPTFLADHKTQGAMRGVVFVNKELILGAAGPGPSDFVEAVK